MAGFSRPDGYPDTRCTPPNPASGLGFAILNKQLCLMSAKRPFAGQDWLGFDRLGLLGFAVAAGFAPVGFFQLASEQGSKLWRFAERGL